MIAADVASSWSIVLGILAGCGVLAWWATRPPDGGGAA